MCSTLVVVVSTTSNQASITEAIAVLAMCTSCMNSNALVQLKSIFYWDDATLLLLCLTADNFQCENTISWRWLHYVCSYNEQWTMNNEQVEGDRGQMRESAHHCQRRSYTSLCFLPLKQNAESQQYCIYRSFFMYVHWYDVQYDNVPFFSDVACSP